MTETFPDSEGPEVQGNESTDIADISSSSALSESSERTANRLLAKCADPYVIGLSGLRSRSGLPNTRTGTATTLGPGTCGSGVAAVGPCPPRLPPPDRQRV